MALSIDIIDANAIYQIVLEASWGTPAITQALASMKSLFPHGAKWGPFGVRLTEFPMVVQPFFAKILTYVNVRQYLFLEKGTLTLDNASLVTKARSLIETHGGSLATAAEARALLGIGGRSQ